MGRMPLTATTTPRTTATTAALDTLTVPGRATLSLTQVLLLCGAIAGPLFIVTVLIQDLTRPGFNPGLQPLSLLALGSWGWVQIANFVLAGALNLLFAVGLWRRLHPGRAGTWGPLLIGVYGLGLVVVGVCRTDPAEGFPPGVRAVTHPSWHGAVHALGAGIIFLVLAAALAVFVRFFLTWKQWRWALYCLASAVLLLGFFIGGMVHPTLTGGFLQLGVLCGWMAASVIAIRLVSAPDPVRSLRDGRP